MKPKRVIITVLIGVVGCWLTAAFNEFAKNDDSQGSNEHFAWASPDISSWTRVFSINYTDNDPF